MAVTELSEQRGVRLALDWGQARIGVAACDPEGTMAYPVETIPSGRSDGAREAALRRVRALVTEYEAVEVVLGWPTNLAGRDGPATEAMARVEVELSRVVAPLTVVRIDERMSTAEAARMLGHAGRDSRRRRAVIDQAAAVGILNNALEARRARRGERDPSGPEGSGDL
jgi:putative holliday junction resolvase